MTRDEATRELLMWLPDNLPEFSGAVIAWYSVGRSFWIAKLPMKGGMALATFTPGGGLTVYDAVGRIMTSGGKWQSY